MWASGKPALRGVFGVCLLTSSQRPSSHVLWPPFVGSFPNHLSLLLLCGLPGSTSQNPQILPRISQEPTATISTDVQAPAAGLVLVVQAPGQACQYLWMSFLFKDENNKQLVMAKVTGQIHGGQGIGVQVCWGVEACSGMHYPLSHRPLLRWGTDYPLPRNAKERQLPANLFCARPETGGEVTFHFFFLTSSSRKITINNPDGAEPQRIALWLVGSFCAAGCSPCVPSRDCGGGGAQGLCEQ